MWIGFCKQKSYNPRTGNDDDDDDDDVAYDDDDDVDADDEFVDDNNIGSPTSQMEYNYDFFLLHIQLILSLLFSTTIIMIVIGMESLIVTPISKAAANQRAGRAGNKD